MHKSLVVEAEKLNGLVVGSYEDLLQRTSLAVDENAHKWGGDVTLFATYPDHVVVYLEDQGFFSCRYRRDGENGIEFVGEMVQEDVPIIDEDMLASRGIDAMYSGRSIGSVLMHIASVSPVKFTPSIAESKIDKLFGRSLWRDYVLKDKARIVEYISKDGSFSIKEEFPFSDGMKDSESVLSSLVKMSQVFSEMNAAVLESVSVYQEKTGGMRTPDEDIILSKFDSIAGDILENIDNTLDSISEAIRESRKGNYGYSKIIYDGVANEYDSFHLGCRFICKMANDLASI